MFLFLIFLALVEATTGKSFLSQVDTQAEVEATLLAEFAGTFRPGATKDNVLEHEAALRPIYAAVPQEADGTLQHSVVRYALHRFFAQRGWFILGLEPGTGAKYVSGESLQALQTWVPSFLQSFLEKVIGGRSISLRELAILAATLEDLIHKESLSRLEKVFHALDLPLSSQLGQEQITEVLEVFMMIYINGDEFSASSPTAVRDEHKRFTQEFNGNWEQVQQWVRDVRQKVHPSALTLDFKAMGSIVEEIGATYGTYNSMECDTLKSELVDVESQKAGRVRLSDFYEKGRSSTFALSEKVDYLRVLGALDETDPNQLHVIIPNYVGARPNCMVTSKFYAICCSNECENLMGELENSLASEVALPEQIIQLVSGLSSDTVSAPRRLSATLVRRLHSIAESNEGKVPLQGRLFAQWMHHAFPRECPFPHQDGTNPQTPDEWMQDSGHATSKVSEEEIKAHVGRDTEEKPKGSEARQRHHFEEHELPWSESEKLLVPSARTKPWSALRTMAVLTLLGSLASGFAWASKNALLLPNHGLLQSLLSGMGGQKQSQNTGLSMYSDLHEHAGKMA